MVRFPSFSLGGSERSILEGIERHIGTVKQCVVTFQGLVAAAAVGDPAAQSLRDRVFELESDAAQIRRELDSQIAEGAFFGGIREDILNLMGEIDTVADAAKDSARLLMMGASDNPSCRRILSNEHMGKFMEDLMSALTTLEDLVKSLRSNKKLILPGVRKVEEWEEAADAEKAALLAELFQKPRTIDPVDVIQMRDFIFAADDIADNSENASDVLIVLVAKGYG